VLVSGLDRSSAFDVINITLQLKRLRIIGPPKDIFEVIKVWLYHRANYVRMCVDGNHSILNDLLLGIVQGSVLGPVFYAIFVSLLFDIEEIFSSADHSCNIESSHVKIDLIKTWKSC
jgi:hypothetical protein